MPAEDAPEERRGTSQEAIIRIDMRTQFMLEEIKSMKEVLTGKADSIDVQELKATVITRYEFNPVRAIAYGLILLVMSAVIGGVMRALIK